MRALLEQSRSESQSAAGVIEAAAAEAESQIAAAQAEAERLKAEAALSGRKAAAQAALSHLKAAFASNLSPDAALGDLEAAGVTLPEGLADTLAAAPSMVDLTETFPAAARLALAASLRASSQDAGTMDKIGAFLRSQTGARSLEPREGDDPDAVLSRAEAAVAAGDLAAALTELAALPDVGRAAVADWSASAQARLDAQAAIDGLSVTLE